MGMLPALIIEEIRKKEKARREAFQQPFLELPLPATPPPRVQDEEDDPERGVYIIQL